MNDRITDDYLPMVREAEARGTVYFDVLDRKTRGPVAAKRHVMLIANVNAEVGESEVVDEKQLAEKKLKELAEDVMDAEVAELYSLLQCRGPHSLATPSSSSLSSGFHFSLPAKSIRKHPHPLVTAEENSKVSNIAALKITGLLPYNLEDVASSEKIAPELGGLPNDDGDNDVGLLTVSKLQPQLESFLRSLIGREDAVDDDRKDEIRKTTQKWIDLVSNEKDGVKKLLSFLVTKRGHIMSSNGQHIQDQPIQRLSSPPPTRRPRPAASTLTSKPETSAVDVSRIVESLRSATSSMIQADLGGPSKIDLSWRPESLEKEKRRQEESIRKDELHIDNQIQAIKEEMEKELRRDEEKRLAAQLAHQNAEAVRQHKIKKAMKIFSFLCKRKNNMLLGMGFKQWKVFLAFMRMEEKKWAATLIQRHVRGLLGRRAFKHMQEEAKAVKDKKARQQNKALMAVLGKTRRSAIEIQCVMRGWFYGRVVYRRLYEEDQAAKAIQRHIRRMKAKREAWYRTRLMQRLEEYVIMVQSRYRTHMAQQQYKILRRRRRHDGLARKLQDYDSLVRTNFEHQGAATKIQIWWRRIPWRFQCLVDRLIQKKKRAAVLIQLMIRIVFAHKMARKLSRRVYLTRQIRACLRAYVKITLWTAQTLRSHAIHRSHTLRQQIKNTYEEDGKDRRILVAGPERKAGVPFEESAVTSPPLAIASSSKASVLSLSQFGKHFLHHPSLAATAFIRRRRKRRIIPLREQIDDLLHPEAAKEKRAKLMQSSALKVQCAWRRAQAIRKVKGMRLAILLAQVTFIQKWYRYRRWRRIQKDRHKCASLIQSIYRAWAHWEHLKSSSAVKIQSLWRGFCQRREAKLLRQQATTLAITVQRLVRGVLARKHVLLKRAKAIQRRDLAIAGKVLYEATVEVEKLNQIFTSSTIPDVHVMMELQRLFLYHTSVQGRYEIDVKDKSPLVMDLSRFLKFCTSAPGLLTQGFNTRAAEAVFDDHKKQKVIGYAEFLQALYTIANTRLKKVQCFGRRTDNDARFLKLLSDVVLPSSTFMKILERMDKHEHYPARSKTRILNATKTIQRVYRGTQGRRQAAKRRQQYQVEKGMRDRIQAATRLQIAWRGHRARTLVSLLAAGTYEKCFDPVSKTYYFFNPTTGQALQTKPKLLHSRDLRNPIEIPAPERNFSIMCGACKKSVAKRWCVDCKEYYCYADYNKVHKKGKASNHQCVASDVCVQCASQVASRSCLKCKDEYCDTCFYSLHKRGLLRLHPYTELTPFCNQCQKYMALVVCLSCSVNLCKSCCNQGHESINGHMIATFPYRSLALQRYEEEMEKKHLAQEKVDEFHQWQAARKERVRNMAATNIQRVWRGYLARKPVRELMGSVTERNHNRLMDNAIRRSLKYMVLDLLGMAPDLPSDGPMEKVLKTFPRHIRPLVKEAVEGEWIPALQMVLEQRECKRQRIDQLALNKNLKSRGKDMATNVREHILLLVQNWKVGKADAAIQQIDVKLKEAQKKLVAGLAKEKDELRKAVKVLKATKVMHGAKRAKLEQARVDVLSKLEARRGPDRLRRKVDLFSRFGKKLDFTLRVRQGRAQFKSSSSLLQSLKPGERYTVGLDPAKSAIFRIERIVTRELPEGVIDCMIFVDRDWMDEDGDEVPLYRLPSFLPHEKFFIECLYLLKRSFWYQLPVKTLVMAMHFTACTLMNWASNYDDESKHALRLQALADAFIRCKKDIMYHRFRYIRVNKSLGLLAASRAAYQDLMQAFRAARSGVIDLKNTLVDAQKHRRLAADPYVMWEKSLDKKQLLIMWRNDATPTDLIKLGEVLIDVDVPCKILREKIRRRLREPLNQKNGEGFLFLNKNGEPLPRYYEESQRGRDIMQVLVNSETRAVEHQCTLLPDAENPFVSIPEIADYEPPVPRKSVIDRAAAEAAAARQQHSAWDGF